MYLNSLSAISKTIFIQYLLFGAENSTIMDWKRKTFWVKSSTLCLNLLKFDVLLTQTVFLLSFYSFFNPWLGHSNLVDYFIQVSSLIWRSDGILGQAQNLTMRATWKVSHAIWAPFQVLSSAIVESTSARTWLLNKKAELYCIDARGGSKG